MRRKFLSQSIAFTMSRKRHPALDTGAEDGSVPHRSTGEGEWTEVKGGSGPGRSLPASGEEDVDLDPVLKTYDVYVSNALKDHIYLLQYPIRNWEEQYTDESAPLSIRMKPNEGIMEFDVPIDTHNYSLEQGKRFGSLQQGLNSPQDGKIFDRQRLSGKPEPNQASYFIGRMRGGKPMSLFRLLMSLKIRCIFPRSRLSYNFVPISNITIPLSAASGGRNSKRMKDK